MKFLTNIIEAKLSNRIIEKGTLQEYAKMFSGKLSQDINLILKYCILYDILDTFTLNEIISASKSGLKELSKELSISESDLESLYKLLTGAKNQLKMLPHFQSEKMTANLLNGKKELSDASLDLISDKGRAAAFKQFTPLINKIVHQYEGRSSLSRSELMSAALEGFTLAMNDYQAPDENYIDTGGSDIDTVEAREKKGLTFKQYAAYRIAQKILDDMNNLSRVVRIPKRQISKNLKDDPSANFNSTSIDAMLSDDPDEVSKADRMKELSQEPQTISTTEEQKYWNKIFQLIESKFSVKVVSIFYQVFGLKGFKKMSGSDVAKEMGCSKAYISKVIKQVTTFLKSDHTASEMLLALQDIYTESLLVQNFNKPINEIIEALAQDDIYMLFEELNKWANPMVLKSSLENVLADYDASAKNFIINCLNKGFEFLDNNYRSNKKMIVHFLSSLYPTEPIAKKSDVYILELMEDVMNAYNKLKIKLDI